MLWASSQYGLIDMPFMTPGNLCNPSVRAGWRGAGSTSFGRASVDVQRQRTYRYQCRVGNPVHITQGNADQDSGKDELPGSSGPPRPPRKQPPDQQDGPLDRLLEWIMPRERGDSRDMALMGLSIAVFVYISMHLYNLYATLYYAAGLKPLSHFLP